MKTKNNGAIEMPKYGVAINKDEMEYLTGGARLGYRFSYQTKWGATIAAATTKAKYGFNRISTYDLAAEIYTHAFAYYHYGAFLAIARKFGIGSGVAKSILDGINVGNGLDTQRIGGVPRYWLYRAVFAVVV